jgi:CRISPR-associated endonuclease Csn1
MATRLGLDMGTNSIGWCLYDGDAIRDMGVRIFSDGREPSKGGMPGASLAVTRRAARAMRRRRDRYLGRRDALLRALVAVGLMPQDKAEAKKVAALDPYPLRAKGVMEKLTPHEFGRALFHLNQRRGFWSNRKTDRDPNETGKIINAAKALDEAMDGRTYGQFLHDNEIKRVRMRPEGDGYDFYPERRHLEEEFDTLWAVQSELNPTLLTEEIRARLHRIIFFQRDLKPAKVGGCTFYNEELRLPKSSTLFQELRLYQEVNHLKITKAGDTARSLTLDERNALILSLKTRKKQTFKSLGKVIKLGDGEDFNKSSENRSELTGDEVFASFSDKKTFGPRWAHFDAGTQATIIEMVENEPDPQVLYDWLIATYGVTIEEAHAIGKIRLPDGHGRLGGTASHLILEKLKEAVITYDEAVKLAIDRSHSDFRTGEILDELPYYGEILSREIPPGTQNRDDPEEIRWGKITNPTVHIGLNQLRKLVNEIIKIYGRPENIVVELARELKLNEKQKADLNRDLNANTKAAMARGAKLVECGQTDNGGNRMRLRIWEELNPSNPLDRRCPFCGNVISIEMLFNSTAEVEHIIPYSRSFDDGAGNKVMAHRTCNREKGNKTPYEKWGETDRWSIIADQVSRLHKSKQWRFEPDAMERIESNGGFIARQLTDTQYLAKSTRSYLSSLYPESEGVYVIPGRMTAMLRRLWGLNDLLPDHNYVENPHSGAPKNRLDHRHHAIDAAVIGVTTRGLLNMISQAAGRAESQERDKLFDGLQAPWEESRGKEAFRNDLRAALDRIVISHKADHGRDGAPSKQRDVTSARLHNDTAYGFTGETSAKGLPIVVRRKPLLSLKPEEITDPIAIPDRVLQSALYAATEGLSGKLFEAALIAFAKRDGPFNGIRHIRVREALNVIPIFDQAGKAFKGYKGDANARYDVWQLPDGKWVTKWKDGEGTAYSSIISMFDAHKRDAAAVRPHPAAKKVLSLRQNDLIAIERGEGPREILRVVKFAAKGDMVLAPHNEAGALKARDADSNDPFKYVNTSASGLKRDKARQIRINPLGHILDPGPR